MNTPLKGTIGWRSILDYPHHPSGAMIAAALAGGQGKRFGGEKCLAPIHGRPMAAWALEAAAAVAESVVIIANKPELYSGFGWPVRPDLIPGMGPLSGLYTAFEVTGAQELFLLACDMPMADPAAIRYIIQRASASSAEAVIPFCSGREQGLFAVYRRRALNRYMNDILTASIQFNQFRLGLEKTIITQQELEEAGVKMDTFMNVNTVEELRSAEKKAPRGQL